MKTLFVKLFFIGLGVSLFTSCKKDLPTDYYKGGTAPVLSASVSGAIPLSNATKGNIEVNFSWTNPNYLFTTGVSSQNVTYLMEIDTLGASFTNINRKQIVIPSDLGISFVDSVFNAYLSNDMLLATGMQHTIQVRVTASINSVPATSLTSNVMQFTVTPWIPPPAINPPSTYPDNPSGTLYIVGSAIAVSGWNNPISPAIQIPIQKFIQMSSTLYQITIPIIGGGEYKLIGVNDGTWTDQWSIKTNDDPTELYGGPFVFNGNNVLAPPTSGTYLIVVDFQHGKFSLTLQ